MSEYLINSIHYEFKPEKKDLVESFTETDFFKEIAISLDWAEISTDVMKDCDFVQLKAKFIIDEEDDEKHIALLDARTDAYISLLCDLLKKIEFEDASTFVYLSEIKDNVIAESFPYIVSVLAGVGHQASGVFLDVFEEMKGNSKLSMHFFSSPFIVQDYPAIKSKIARYNEEGYQVELKINKANTAEGTRSLVHFGHYDPDIEDIGEKIRKIAKDVMEEQVTVSQPIMVHCYQKISNMAGVEYLIFRKGLPAAAVSDEFMIDSVVAQLNIHDSQNSWRDLFRVMYYKFIRMFSNHQ